MLQDIRVDDFWNVGVDRNVSDSWTGFMKFTLLDEKSPTGHTWSGRRLAQIRATTRPDCLWPEIWTGMSKAALNMEKQECSYFLDPKDGEHKETITNARKSWTRAWQLNKVKSKEGGYSGSRKRQKESPTCDIDGHLSSQKCRVRIILSEV